VVIDWYVGNGKIILLRLMMSININLKGDMCLADSATTHTILKDKKYFSYLVKRETDVSIISKSSKIIECSERVNVILCGGIILNIENALYSSKCHRNLLISRISV